MKKRYMEKGVEEEQFTNEFTNFVFTWKIEAKDFSPSRRYKDIYNSGKLRVTLASKLRAKS